MSELTGFARWAELMDKRARDEELTPEDAAFCERFARDNAICRRELDVHELLADLDAPPDAESLSLVERALRRLEAEDAERAVAEVQLLRHPRPPLWLIASGVAAVALVLGLGLRGALSRGGDAAASGPRPLTRAELVYASGQVVIGAQRAASAPVLLSEGTLIETQDGVACVLIDSDINICLAAHSGIRLSAIHAPARRVELTAGRLATRLSSQPEGMSLTIEAGDVTSMAVGTAFAVERTAQAPIVTTVLNGKVRVSQGSASSVVNAHERATSEGERVRVSALNRAEEAASWALLAPTMLWHDPVSGALELSADAPGTEAWLDGQPIGRAPLWSLVPTGSHRLLVRSGDQVLLDEQLHWNAGEARAVRVTTRAEPPPSPDEPGPSPTKPRRRAKAKLTAAAESAKLPAQPEAEPASALSAPTPAELLRSARKLMREGRMQAAADAYETLRATYPQSHEAHTVLVSLAQLQLRALHDPKRALERLDAYLERGGALNEEARLTRIRALSALGRTAGEAAAIREFLAEHPRSFEVVALRERLAALAKPR
jgi:hypothetical protein